MIFLVLIIILHLFILSRLIFFPYPELFVYPYLINQGLLPYRDILDQHFPGLMFFPVNLGNLGMNTPEIARLWQYGLVALTHLILFLIAKKLFGSEKKALLTNFFYLLWQPFFEGWILWIDSFLPLLLLPAFYFLSKKRFFPSGLFLGLALLFKQVTLVLIILGGLYILIKHRNRRSLVEFGLGLLPPIVVLLWYIQKLGVWDDFFFWTVTFNLTTFAEMGRKYPEASLLMRALFVFLPFVLVSRKNILLTLFFVGSLVFAYARFDFVHLQPALPFAALGFVWVAQGVLKKLERKVIFLLLLYTLGALVILLKFYQGHLGSRIFFFGETEKKITEKVESLTSLDDKIFTLGTFPHVYQMTKRLPPGNVFAFQFPWFMKHAEKRVLSGIMSQPPKVVIRDKAAMVDEKNLVSYMPQINDFVNKYYKLESIVDGVEILIKR